MQYFLFSCLLFATLIGINAQIPCDEAYGQHCPTVSSWEVGTCLKNLQAPDIPSDACLQYIKMHDICKADIELNCNGKEYTGDIIPCLSEWTKPEQVSAECLEAVPKPVKKERVMTDKEKKKAAQRRKIRKQAEKLAREL